MARLLVEIVLASAAYGFAIGSVHSPRLAARNLIKFPLLIGLTSVLCALAYFVFAKFLTRRLSFRDVLALALRSFRDVAVLLASLAPASYFLARTAVRPDEQSLNEYPFFLGLNVFFIALCGVVALVRQTLKLLRGHGIDLRRSAAIVLCWLAISLFAGGQCAWYLRPFFGPSTIRHPPFIEGTNPDYRGATSFYEAVYHLIHPPPLPEDYFRRGRRPVAPPEQEDPDATDTAPHSARAARDAGQRGLSARQVLALPAAELAHRGGAHARGPL